MMVYLEQFRVLIVRNFNVLMNDRGNLILALSQAVIIGVLMILAFDDCWKDKAEADRFTKIIRQFNQRVDAYEQAGRSVPVEQAFGEARAAAADDRVHVSEANGSQRAAIYFALIASAMWFGVMNSCREIVSEKALLDRELRGGLHLSAYLLAKLLVLGALTAVQTGILGALVIPLLGLGWSLGIQVWAICWLVALTAISLGLLISSIAASVRVALTVVPLIMMPQLLFGGVMRPPILAEQTSRLASICGTVTTQRWGFYAVLKEDVFNDDRILESVFNWEPSGSYGRYNLIRVREKSLTNMFFKKVGEPQPILILMLTGCLQMMASWIWLKRKSR